MKKVSKIYRKTVIAATVVIGVLMSSCTDYLTIIPADKVVEENFWQTKDQVNGMLATSYLKLLKTDAVERMIVWGDLRSDNMINPSNKLELKNLVEANITDENKYSNWSIFYEAINYANLVIESAPVVLERDPDFTEGDLQVVTGEMYAMRALCHFYLVRTFRDIPLAMKSAKNDSEIPDYVQVHPLVALDSIMADLNRAENMVMKSGAFQRDDYNFGRITRNAVLAMKADVNLWRAAFATYYQGKTDLAKNPQGYYDECIKDCDKLLKNMDDAIEEENKNKPVMKYPYNLIQNEVNPNIPRQSTAYNKIFGSGNSSESIFELQITGTNATNGYAKGIYNIYGIGKESPGLAIVPQTFLDSYPSDDLRKYSYTSYDPNAESGSNTYIVKYSAKSSPASDYRKSDDFDANWIIYRRTDVMLMKAEALVTRESADEDDFLEAFNIVNAINTRSREDATNIYQPMKFDSYKTKENAMKLVRDERKRELSFEGKRWYDLVRQALIEKKVDNILFVADKLGTIAEVVKTKMSTIDALFMPIYIDEIRYNKNLKQNPAFEDKNSSTEMN